MLYLRLKNPSPRGTGEATTRRVADDDSAAKCGGRFISTVIVLCGWGTGKKCTFGAVTHAPEQRRRVTGVRHMRSTGFLG